MSCHLNYKLELMANLGDMEHAMVQYTKTMQEYRKKKLNFVDFADGWIFATLLQSASNFKIKYAQLIQNCTKWTHRLTNLKKIVALIEEYFEEQIKKGIKTKDIDLIEIAKNYNVDQTLKMFELIIAVLTEAPNKEDHINTIMSLDEKSQGTFVFIIQNLLENRILDKNQTKEDKVFQTINHLQLENSLLRSEVESLLNQNHQMQKQIEELKHRQLDYEDELRKARDLEIDKTHILHEEPKERQHLRNMVENLKEKLISTVRESEIKISGMRQEIHVLQSKFAKFQEVEEQLQDYKRKYNQTIESYGKAKLWERQKNKLIRTVEDKDQVIKKLTAKLDEANEINFAMQEREVYAKMQLEKRDVRFKELEKQVKKKYGTNNSISSMENAGSCKSLQLTSANVAVLSQDINEIDRLEIQELQSQIQQLKKKNRDSERENNKLKRSLQKASNLESEKKKLERLILDLSNQKREQVEVLLSTTYQFYFENQRLRALLKTDGKI